MEQGRHIRRTGLLGRLSPGPAQPPWRTVHAHSLVLLSDQVQRLDGQVAQLREACHGSMAAAAAAELRAERAEEQLTATRDELQALRADLAALREDLVWAFAEGEVAADGGPPVARPRPVASAG